jgi:hypothetical protein
MIIFTFNFFQFKLILFQINIKMNRSILCELSILSIIQKKKKKYQSKLKTVELSILPVPSFSDF